MLPPRQPTRIELQPSDKAEYEALKRQHKQASQKAGHGEELEDPLAQGDKRSAAARIGLQRK